MGTSNKILGKAKPAAVTGAVLFTVGATKQAMGELAICNQGAATTVRIAFLSTGVSTPAVADYVFYDVKIGVGTTITKSFCLAVGESVWVYSTSGGVSFVATGLEIV